MSALLVVRDIDALPRACRAAGELLALRRRRGGRDETGATVLGTWIDAHMAREIPVALNWDDRAVERAFPVLESAGVPCVWAILWLGLPVGMGLEEARRLIAQALIESTGPDGASRASGRFVPVFAANAAAEAVQAEMRRLRARFPGRLAPPLLQDPVTGRLSSFPAGEADG